LPHRLDVSVQDPAAVKVVNTGTKLNQAIEYPRRVESFAALLGALQPSLERAAVRHRHQHAHVAAVGEGVLVPAACAVSELGREPQQEELYPSLQLGARRCKRRIARGGVLHTQ
jgi:hypothetical protein